MEDAAESMHCIIPTRFSMYDESTFDMKECTFGCFDENECEDKTQSCTQRCYSFEIGKIEREFPPLDPTTKNFFFFVNSGEFMLKIIDTPGIADCRGVDRDTLNLKHLLSFISNYRELNAICVLLKPNNAKVGVVFKYCILELLSQ